MTEHRQLIGLLAGPLLFASILLLPAPDGMSPEGQRVAATAALMAVWWLTEAIPIPATALLPILLFPLLGVLDGGTVTRAYGHHLIYLFLGGFLIAVTMEKWNLHHRIALYTIRMVGVTPQRIVLGFMLATAFLSMWISNTAATMMMVTIALAVLHEISHEVEHKPGEFRFATALVLGIGYAATIGGVATLIGTPPNAIFAGVVERTYGYSVGFLDWMRFALPLSIVMLVLTWFYLTRILFRSEIPHLPGGRDFIRRQIAGLGPMSREEKAVAIVFVSVALLWMLRGLYHPPALSMIKDSTIAIAGALVLFMIPVNLKKREFLLDWKTAVTIPWDIIILFGGGFALAQGFSDTGLTSWLAERLAVLQGVEVLLVIGAMVLLVIFLTEVTSNTATASLLLPVTGALAEATGVHPYGMMVAAVVASSFAFMLPVATPPNAIVYGSRYVTIMQMAKAGIWLNLIGAVLITAFVYYLLPRVWGIEL
ncbi:MAG: DASS family sodium-coupled anion symporter [Gammaproteobacteria bacterium]|nr:DASS family sodium-coupled anion symporter [Gammaproteobacteria bacterium]